MKLFAVALLFFITSPTYAEIIAPADAPTTPSFAREHSQFDLDLDIHAYKKANAAPHDWDADAIDFITQVTRYRTGESWPNAELLEKKGRTLFVNGCDDPLVLSCYGHVLQFGLQRPLAAIPILEQARANLAKRGYSQRNLAIATRTLWQAWASQFYTDQPKQIAKPLVGAITEMIATQVYPANARRFLVDDVYNLTEGLDLDNLKALSARLDNIAACDELVKKLVAGRYHLRAAYVAQAAASNADPQNAKAFDQHKADALAALARAYELDPTLPQAAAELIFASLDNKTEARKWFEASIKARVDYVPAYQHYRTSLTPRFGGSAADIYAFGVECAATARYDTQIPRQLYLALETIDHNRLSSVDPWIDPKSYPLLKKMFEGYLASPQYKDRANQFASTLCAIALRTRHYDDAREVLDDIDEHLDTAAVAQLHFTPEELRARIFAMTGPAKLQAAAIFASEKQKDYPAAIKLCDEAAAIPQSTKAIQFFKSHAQTLKWKADFDAGKPVTLSANHALEGFTVRAGEWHAEADGAILGRQNQMFSAIKCDTDFGSDWTLSADVDILYPSDYWASAGITLFAENDPLYTIRLLHSPKTVLAGYERTTVQPVKADVRTFNKLNVTLKAATLSLTLNGKPVITNQPVGALPATGLFLGFSSYHARPGDIVRFSNITIQKSK